MKRWPALASTLVLVLAALSAAADFLDSYKAALDAIDKKEWSAAAKQLRAAIAERPQEADRVPSRFYFKRYLPHFYLGLALAEQGDCDSALASWRESERQGVVQRFEERRRLDEGKARCSEKLSLQAAELTAAADAAEDAVQRATETERRAAAALEALRSSNGAAPDLAALEARSGGAGRGLATARARLASGLDRGDRALLAEASGLAETARGELAAIATEAEALAGRATEARDAAVRALETATSAARRTLASTNLPRPWPKQLTDARAALEGLVQQADKLRTAGAAADLAELTRSLEAAQVALRRLAAPPPAALVSAAEALFAGRYQQVLDLLARPDLGERRANAHALLLRAAARFLLSEQRGATDPAELEAVRADIRASYALDPALKLAEAFLSPRFCELHRQTVASLSR